MSAFERWQDSYFKDNVKTLGAHSRMLSSAGLEIAFNAGMAYGMERAAVIAEHSAGHWQKDPLLCMDVALAIRAEIKGQGTDND